MIPISLILSTLLIASSSAEAEDGTETSPIGYRSVADALSDLQQRAGNSVRVEAGWTIIDDPSTSTLWSFIPLGHAAYPAAVKRTVVERDGQIYVEMSALCQAKKVACDELMEQFKLLNEQVRLHMQQQVGE